MSQPENSGDDSAGIARSNNQGLAGWNLSLKIFSAFALATLLPLGATSWRSDNLLNTRLQARISADLNALADSAARQLSAQLDRQIGDARDLTRLPLFADAIGRAANSDTSDPAAGQGDLRHTDFTEFSGFMRRRGYDDFMLISPRGKVIFCLGGLLPVGTDLHSAALKKTPLTNAFARAQADGKAAFSSIGRNPRRRGVNYYMVLPAKVQQGLPGALALRLTPGLISEFSRNIKHVGSSAETVIGTRGDDERILLAAFRDASPVHTGSYADGAVAEPMRRALRSGSGMGLGRDYRGKTVLAAWRFLPRAQWGLVIKADARQIFAETSALRRRTLTALAAAMLIAALFSWLLARSIGAPIQRLEKAANEIAAGSWPARLKVHGGGEIASLTQHFNGMVNDLRTETQRAQERLESLQTSRGYLQAIIESSGEGIIVIDATGLIRSVNPKTEALFGHPSQDLVGNNISMLLPATERAAHDRYLQRSDLHAPRIINRSRDLFAQHRDGRQIPIELTVSPMRWEGAPMFVGIVNDISERVAATRTLQVSEKKYLELFRYSPSAYAGVDVQGRITRHNAAYADLLGYSGDNLVGRHVLSLHPDTPSSQQSAIGILDQVLHGQTVRRSETDLLHRDGHVIKVEISTRPLLDEHGKLRESLATLVDITQRKNLEAALREAKRAAEQASAAKSAFLSSTSHELRTPLNAILGFSKMLESDRKAPLQPDQSRRVRHIIDGGKHLLELINGVLDLAKIESGAAQAALEAVDVNEMLAECKTFMAPLARRHKVKLDYRCACPPDCTERVAADPVMLKQVLLNLIGNAIKYNRPHGTVGISCAGSDHGWVRVSVTDTGPGIAEHAMDDLFVPFHRLEAANGEIEGAGIGLTVCKHLVNAMGGKIGVHSKLGKGSEFWFELPPPDAGALDATATLRKNGRPIHRQTTRPGRVEEAPHQHLVFESGRILLADDNPLNQELCQSFLQDHGLRVDIVGNGLDALKALESTPIDLVLMDVHMPKLDGLSTVRRIRATTAREDLPVIGISADAFAGDIEAALAAGMNDYIAKPVDVFELLAMIGQYLPHRKADSQDG